MILYGSERYLTMLPVMPCLSTSISRLFVKMNRFRMSWCAFSICSPVAKTYVKSPWSSDAPISDALPINPSRNPIIYSLLYSRLAT
jgi:hypothetical protein